MFVACLVHQVRGSTSNQTESSFHTPLVKRQCSKWERCDFVTTLMQVYIIPLSHMKSKIHYHTKYHHIYSQTRLQTTWHHFLGDINILKWYIVQSWFPEFWLWFHFTQSMPERLFMSWFLYSLTEQGIFYSYSTVVLLYWLII